MKCHVVPIPFVLTVLSAAGVLLVGACRPAADLPPQTPAAQPTEAGEPSVADTRDVADGMLDLESPEPPLLDRAPSPPELMTESEQPPEGEPSSDTEESVQPALDVHSEPQRDLGPPLVDSPDRLQPLLPPDAIWFDPDNRAVVMVGEVCQRYAPLELFACLRYSKEHESVVVVDTKAYVVHAGLLAAGAEPGNPVEFYPEFAPARGTEIEITVRWLDPQGRRRQARGQDWVHDVSAGYEMYRGVVLNPFDDELDVGDQHAAWKAMEYPWVFGGSRFVKDETTGEEHYLADADGCLVCVANFTSAVLDLPARSTDSAANLLFTAFTERIPALGTPVTLILTPKL